VCGIVGRVNFLSRKPVDRAVLGRMNDLIAHRGPDDEGLYASGHVGLGNRRLAIVDLTSAGHQPMSSDDGRSWITYNGEIYNFPELRAELEARGQRFRSHTDTEVILAAYREYGVQCLDRLRGMFAFAIWDTENERLFIARDRVGKKPLHYWLDADGIAFASEPKAFLADPGFVPRPDLAAISLYLTYQYVPSPASAFAGVAKLPPGHYMIVENGRITTHRYWRLRYGHKVLMREEEACRQIVSQLREAVRIRLISDVPLGAFLSGGIDSSVVVALMSELGGRVKTFSIGFEQKEYDETAHARLVAKRFETDHHEFVVRPDAVDIIPELVWHYNEPYADSSAIPSYYLAKLTREHVTVALNGDGGDEDFAGYDRYVANVAAARIDRIPRGLRLAAANAAELLGRGRNQRNLFSRGQRFLGALTDTPVDRYARWISHFAPPLKDALCTADFTRGAGDGHAFRLIRDAYAGTDANDVVDATLDVDVNTYLPEDLLVKMDIATMANSLEARSPFLDHQFMEFCASLPSQFKLGGLVKKRILKRALRGVIPDEIIDRPKMGFGVPIDHWFRYELRPFAEDVLLDTTARERGYFDQAVVAQLLDEHVRGVARWHSQLWNLLMLELWHRTFIDRRPQRDPVDHPLVEIGRTRREGALAGSAPTSAAERDTPDGQ
jgi:asparagine synthase (glutamine-hydrolysing)